MRNRPRRSLGHVFVAGSATDIERVHWPSCRLNQTRIEGVSRSIWSPGNAASRICSSCSHTSLFSIAAPGAKPGPGAARFQAANQTWRSSPFRTSRSERRVEDLLLLFPHKSLLDRGSRRQAWARRGAVPGREPDLALVALPDFLRQQILRSVFGNRDARFHHTRGDIAEDSAGGLENRLKGVARRAQLRRPYARATPS